MQPKDPHHPHDPRHASLPMPFGGSDSSSTADQCAERFRFAEESEVRAPRLGRRAEPSEEVQ
jgi:hypothetical protein